MQSMGEDVSIFRWRTQSGGGGGDCRGPESGSQDIAISPGPQRADDVAVGQRKEGKAPSPAPSLTQLDLRVRSP